MSDILGCPETMSPEEWRDHLIEEIAKAMYSAGERGAVTVDALYQLPIALLMCEGIEEEEAISIHRQRFKAARRAKALTATLLNHAVSQKDVHVQGAAS